MRPLYCVVKYSPRSCYEARPVFMQQRLVRYVIRLKECSGRTDADETKPVTQWTVWPVPNKDNEATAIAYCQSYEALREKWFGLWGRDRLGKWNWWIKKEKGGKKEKSRDEFGSFTSSSLINLILWFSLLWNNLPFFFLFR